MRCLERVLVCLLTVLVATGCSAPSNGDGGTDVVMAQDVLGADTTRDAVDVQSVDTGLMDTGLPTDSGTDAVSGTDAGTDAVAMIDGGTDAVSSTDTGTDVFSASDSGTDAISSTDSGTDAVSSADTGRDAAQPDVGTADTGTTPDASGPPTCPGTMHVCLCATGYYCLRIGFGCLSPSSPCP